MLVYSPFAQQHGSYKLILLMTVLFAQFEIAFCTAITTSHNNILLPARFYIVHQTDMQLHCYIKY